MRNGFFMSALVLLLASGCSDVPAAPDAALTALSAKTIQAQQQTPIPPSMVAPPVDDTFERMTGNGQMTNDNIMKVIALYAQAQGGSQGVSPENVSRMTQNMRQRGTDESVVETGATASQAQQQQKYRGFSGATYKYDLSQPRDEIMYGVDPKAQMMDGLDPRVEMDRSMGQAGGGVER